MRERIAISAALLFDRLPIRSVSMSEVAAGAGVSKRTLYEWYSDKNELVKEVYLPRLAKARRAYENILENADDAIDEVIRCWKMISELMVNIRGSKLHDLQKFHADVYDQYLFFKNGFLYQMVIANIERGKKEGLYRKNIHTEIIARHQIATFGATQNAIVNELSEWSGDRIDEELMLQYLSGLATTEGIRRIEEYSNQNINGEINYPLLNV